MNTGYNGYTPWLLPTRGYRFITPYWADVDTRGTGEIYYRQTTSSGLLARATNEIRTAFPVSQNVNITNLFIATWDAVGYNSRHTDKVRLCINCDMYVQAVSIS